MKEEMIATLLEELHVAMENNDLERKQNIEKRLSELF